jgi:hypothetical protein
VAAIDHHGELDRARPAEVDQGVQRRADGAAGEEDVVDQDDAAVVDRERNVGEPDHRLRPDRVPHQVVPVEGDVERPDRHLGAGDFVDRGGQPPGEGHAAGADADEGQFVDAAVALDDLVRDAGQRPRHAQRVDYERHGDTSGRAEISVTWTGIGAGTGTGTSCRPHRTALKEFHRV